ncbi:intradiol ring-cleavage dioxygenase [Methylobacterium sp. 77]|uniref:intradiol ring-cleavage dioxygenase n=1 Tax=Methylobacterium sp. 77 TaxID=1101192 RepID=UPI0003600DE9|nr:intradiol ring-cleavage dioxygenase [Methylobacterium sp. 77]
MSCDHGLSRRAALFGLTASSTGAFAATKDAHPARRIPLDSDACILTPQSIEGPYYLDPRLVRSDIAEGRSGVPLRLRLRVIHAAACIAIHGARVDVWHADAQGLYSGYQGQGDTRKISTLGQAFLRGTQASDENGWATFETIYPGWYPGRATHIHFKVFLDERTLVTGQMYLVEAINEFVYGNIPAYGKRHQPREILNATDRIALDEDPQRLAFCAIKEERDRYVATLSVGVDRRAPRHSGGLGPIAGAGFLLPPPLRSLLGFGSTPNFADRVDALVPGARARP